MAVKTVYKATNEYRDPNTGTIYLDSAAKNKANVQSGGVGSNSSAASASGSSSKRYTPYSVSQQTRALRRQSQDYADEIESMKYSPSQTVRDYQSKLKETENAKPGPYQSAWTDKINSLLDSILNEKEFSYTGKDLMSDDMYKMYSEMYEENARKAMQDAQGEAAGMTGGYGSTYSQAAGQQAYDDKMSAMNEIAMDLADKAYTRYLNDRANRYQQLGAVTDRDDTDYSRYRDEVGDWQTDRNYYAGRYDSEYNRDYGQFRDAVSDKQYLANYYQQLYGLESGNELDTWKANEAADEFYQNYLLSENADARADAEAKRAAEEWEYQRQLLQLQIQQAQQKLAGGSGSSGSGGSSSKSTSTGTYRKTPLSTVTNNNSYVSNGKSSGSGWVSVDGVGRMTWSELKKAVDRGDVTETWRKGKVTYKLNPSRKK